MRGIQAPAAVSGGQSGGSRQGDRTDHEQHRGRPEQVQRVHARNLGSEEGAAGQQKRLGVAFGIPYEQQPDDYGAFKRYFDEVLYGETLRVTTDPAPTVAAAPITTPPRMVDPEPTLQSCSKQGGTSSGWK